MQKSLRRTFAFIRKETIQSLRDWRTLLMMLALPIMMMFFFAYAVNLLVDHMPTAVADMSKDDESRAFIEALEISGYFDVKMHVESEEDVIRMIDVGQAKAGVVIPPDFAARVERGDAQVLIVLDGSESLTVQTGYSAASAIAQTHSVELLMGKAGQMGAALGLFGGGALPIDTSTRVLYNPDMDGLVFMVPGIAAILLQFLTVGQVAMVVVRERELGTLEQLLITPVRPLELIISKVVPNIFITVADTVLIVLIGVVWFDVPFRGSIGLFAWVSLLFIVSGLGLGLLVSTVSQTQKQAQQITAVLILLATMLTGLFYPRLTMPPLVRAVGNLLPVTYFIRIARGIITKGIGLSFMWRDVVILAIYAVVVIVLASLTFRKRLD
ncbi:MAG: ABC transporter permease [Anaerolineae bacterium]|nr:ABC transporter permease [Anaerolineae bacterium]